MSFQYPGGTEAAVEGLNLTIGPGELVALVGENGAGKSTLVKLLLRFYDVDRGSVRVGGVDVRVVVPQRVREWAVSLASRSFFPNMVEAGVHMYSFRPDATLHAKSLLVDHALMVIGSANMDQRYFRIKF